MLIPDLAQPAPPEEEEPPAQEALEEPAEEEPAEELPPPLTRQQIEEQNAALLEEVCSRAAAKAYSEALLEKRGELKSCISEVGRSLEQIGRLHDEFIEAYTRQLRFMAVDIAEKIMLQKIEEDDMALSRLVMQAVNTVKNAQWITVEVSERLTALVDYIKGELEGAAFHGKASVQPKACPDDTCRVETENGTLVATVSVQAKNLRAAFAANDA